MWILIPIFFTIAAHASNDIQFEEVKMSDGNSIQTCTLYPDPRKFTGKLPALMIVSGSGKYDSCKGLESEHSKAIANKGVILFLRQKRGLSRNLKTGKLEMDRAIYEKTDIPVLKSDTLDALEHLLKNPRVDASRVAVWGGSEGTIMATHLGLKHPELKEICLMSAMVESFDVLFTRQLSTLVPEGSLKALDLDKSGDLDSKELTDEFLIESGMKKFSEVDLNHDNKVSLEEFVREVHRAAMYSLAADDSTFFLSDFAAGVSVQWVKSAYKAESLGDKILQLKMPVEIHHGRLDVHTLIEPVYKLEDQAKQESKSNLHFHYYNGLDHKFTLEVVIGTLNGIADRLLNH